MVGWIVVVDTPYYAQAAEGAAQVNQRRAGRQLQAARLAPPHGTGRCRP